MNKRGVTPVVATVLLIAIVVVLGVIIFFWAKNFLTESAQKGDRSVSISCGQVEFNAKVVADALQCPKPSSTPQNPQFYSAVDIDNIGNTPIYGVQILEYDQNDANVNIEPLSDQPFVGGTITKGKSSYACLDRVVVNQDNFRIIPKLLAQQEDNKIVYTCPEMDGIAVTFVDI
jgi:flagellin-like protein